MGACTSPMKNKKRYIQSFHLKFNNDEVAIPDPQISLEDTSYLFKLFVFNLKGVLLLKVSFHHY